MPRFDRDIQAPYAFKEATKTTPDHMMQALVFVPASAILMGFAATLGWAMLCWGLRTEDGNGAWVMGGLVTLAALVVGEYVLWKDQLYNTIEEITGYDLNQDGYIGQPPSVAIETHYSPTQMEVDKLPGPPQMIEAWARTALEDGSLAYSVWADRFGSHVTPMGRKVELYRAFREVCRARKLITEQGTHSCELTAHGRDYFEAMLRGKQTPLLEG